MISSTLGGSAGTATPCCAAAALARTPAASPATAAGLQHPTTPTAWLLRPSPIVRVIVLLVGVWPRIVDADQYLHAVLIAVLLVSETTIEKLADHHISAEEVRQVSDGDRIVIRNPRPRVEGSVLMVGPTHGGRVLTVVLNPDPVDDGTWHVRTAWPASAAQTNRYRRDR
jgi:hypothetical protein